MSNNQGGETTASATDRLELYKSLRAELTGYVEKVPALWPQKFLLFGAVIAFLVINSGGLEHLSAGRDLVVAAVAAIPILSLLLDAKILQCGMRPSSATPTPLPAP